MAQRKVNKAVLSLQITEHLCEKQDVKLPVSAGLSARRKLAATVTLSRDKDKLVYILAPAIFTLAMHEPVPCCVIPGHGQPSDNVQQAIAATRGYIELVLDVMREAVADLYRLRKSLSV
jgi:hypothetical protein